MNTNRATLYVEDLPIHAVSRTQYFVLRIIAIHFKEKFGAAVISSSDLASEVRMTERNLRNVLGELHRTGILEYKPGVGAGNFSQFRFPALMRESRRKEVKKGQERGRKEEKSNTTIKEENLNPNLIQGPPSVPPQSAGGDPQLRPLAGRRIKELREMINYITERRRQEKRPIDLAEIVEASCASLLIPLEQAWRVLEACGLGDVRKPAKNAKRERTG